MLNVRMEGDLASNTSDSRWQLRKRMFINFSKLRCSVENLGIIESCITRVTVFEGNRESVSFEMFLHIIVLDVLTV